MEKAAILLPEDPEVLNNLGFALKDLGRLNEAEATYRRALQVYPDFAEALSNLGVVLKDLGDLEQAEAFYRRALQIKPDIADTHSNLGIVLNELGRFNESETCYRRALELNPGFAKAYNNLGNTLSHLGRLSESEASYRRALEIKPNYAEACNNLGTTLKCLGRLEEAVASCRRAIKITPDYAEAHVNLGFMVLEQGGASKSLSHFRKASDLDPSLLRAQEGLSVALKNIVPEWHVPMMNEQKRNAAYYNSLESAIAPNSEVFEIGTGSGLLAMMAAKLNAKKVTTCEAEPILAETAEQIIADNGYEKIIKVISKQSTNVKVGEDLLEKADILVSEIFSSELIGENVIPSIEDAKRRLLKPHARIIPAAGSIMVALFSGNDIRKNLIVEDSFGFNLHRFNALLSKRRYIARNDLNIEMLTDDVEAFRFDFENDSFFPSQSKRLRIPITSSGRCYGIIQWIQLQMDKDIVFANHPTEKSPVSNWQHCAYVFPNPIDVILGQVAVVSASHNRTIPWFTFDGIESTGL